MESHIFYACGKCGQVSPADSSTLQQQQQEEVSSCVHCRSHKRQGLENDNEPAIKRVRTAEPDKRTARNNLTNCGMYEYETAFQSRLKSCFFSSDTRTDLTTFQDTTKQKMITYIQQQLTHFPAVKINFVAECTFTNTNGEETDRTFKTKNRPVFQSTDLDEFINDAFVSLIHEKEEAEMKKSGWSLHAVDGIRVKICKYNPLKASSYVPLPRRIANTRSCINIRNEDDKCFKYAVLAKFVHTNPGRVSEYKKLQHPYDFSSLSFPTSLNEIKIFEKNNNISINVFGIDKEEKIYPLKIVDTELPDHRDLLLLKTVNGKNHYVYIKNFNRLVHHQLTKHDGALLICKRCFSKFDSQGDKTKDDKLKEHKLLCNKNKPVRIEMPDKSHIEFTNVGRSLRVPFVVYCDIESILKPIDGCRNNPSLTYSLNYQHHEAMSYCAYLKISDDIVDADIVRKQNLPTKPKLYRGDNTALHLLHYLKELAEKVANIYQHNEEMRALTDEQHTNYMLTDICYMCDKHFTDQDIKVRDHCHITGNFRGAAHNSCNLLYHAPNYLPVMFHNLSGYDGHFLVKHLDYDNKPIDVIPNTEEKYISFTKTVNKTIKLRFLDTYRFMPSSLDNLARNLPSFTEVSKFFPPSQQHLIIRKGVFPYDYITCTDKLQQTSLPPKDQFYNRLTGRNICDDDYAHAQMVWKTFNFSNLGEYSDHYLLTDVLLLTDIFENFRRVTLTTHKLDPCYYYTLPGLSWDAMLRFTGVKLELMKDYDQLMMVENGIRGGICQVVHRYCEANNEYLDDYDPTKPTTYLTYQDCNNLYGYAMVQPLPYAEFEWVNPDSINVEHISINSEHGYILDVDIDYPMNLHDIHNDLPFLVERTTINNHKKLVPHLDSRQNYIVHYITLQQALTHGLKIKQINRVLKFRQSTWLKPYIDHNTSLRTAATNNFEKDLYKLYNNAVYGKTMENIRNRKNIQLVCDKNRIEKLTAKPDFIDFTIYTENLAAVHLTKKKIVFDKPIYVGMTILDLSKHTMYDYHYNVMLPKYGTDRLKLAYMDTDSFIYHIKTTNLFDDMLTMLDYLDTSDYDCNHPCYSIKNKKVLGKFKDEVNGKIIKKFVGLRPKMYSLQIGDQEITKAKGVQTSALKKYLHFSDYEQCLRTSLALRTPMNRIQSKRHTLATVEINKLSLSPYDDKRIIQLDGISTLAHGHKDLTEPTYLP